MGALVGGLLRAWSVKANAAPTAASAPRRARRLPTNAITAKPAPTFTLDFANSGAVDETNVVCQVTVTGTSVSGKTVVAKTTAGQTLSCQVKLNAPPPTGTYSVVARIDKVPGEKNLANNVLTFPVTFQ